MEIFTNPFMIRALVAAVLTGLIAPSIGTYLVQRRLGLLGDGIGHIAVTGVAIGVLTGTSPLITAILVTILGAVLIELIRSSGKASGDVALAMLFYGGIAGGLVIISLSDSNPARLQQYLFGSLTSLTNLDIWVAAGLTLVVVGVCYYLKPVLFAVSYDEEHAKTLGLPTRALGVLLACLAAITVVVAMRSVGLLLVSALMVIPVATAQQFTKSFSATWLLAMGIGGFVSFIGIVSSGFVPAPPGGLIVLVALAVFSATFPIGMLLSKRRRALIPFEDTPNTHDEVDEPHQHVHGPGCGHLAVPHGDHLDYLHDGHRHAPHGEHYDEH